MESLDVRQVRSFNRIVTESIGALDDRFLGRERPMGEARLLWEIGTDGAEVRSLRKRLGLDSGYVSRVLRALERQGLIRVRVNPADRRVRRAQLTEAGLVERAELDRLSDALAQRILEPLSDRQRSKLVGAMAEIEGLLQASLVQFSMEDPKSQDAKWCFEQYFKELDSCFEGGFNPGRSLPATLAELTPPAGALFIARLRGHAVGCGALKLHGMGPAELKRMWIAPSVRGLGLAQRLLSELEQYAREQGVALIRLETNRSLSAAIALYRRSGYVEVEAFNDEPYAHHWFEKRL